MKDEGFTFDLSLIIHQTGLPKLHIGRHRGGDGIELWFQKGTNSGLLSHSNHIHLMSFSVLKWL